MIKSNFHTHTVYCDGSNTPEEMVNSAINLGFETIGFSVHSPLPYKNDYAILENRVGEYYNEIEELKTKYKDKINILNGIELDYDSIATVDTTDFDYIIGAVHQLIINEKVYTLDFTASELQNCVDECFNSNWLDFAKKYFDTIVDFVKKVDFDILAHFDLISKFNGKIKLFDEFDKKYLDLAYECIDQIKSIKPTQVFEINTGAMNRAGKLFPYPNIEILKYLKQNNFRIVINSDTHQSNSIDFNFDLAIDYCKKAGYNEVYSLNKNSEFVAQYV